MPDSQHCAGCLDGVNSKSLSRAGWPDATRCIQCHQLYPTSRHFRGVTGGHTTDRWRHTWNWGHIFNPRHVSRTKRKEKTKKNPNKHRNTANKQKNPTKSTKTQTNQPTTKELKQLQKTNNKNTLWDQNDILRKEKINSAVQVRRNS